MTRTANLPAPAAVNRRRRRLGRTLLVLAVLLVYPAVTYVQALTDPGAATFAARTADWAREMGAGPVVNALENWWYTRHPPADHPPGADTLPKPASPTAGDTANTPAALPVSPDALPGEGVWAPEARTPGGQAADYTAFVRPDRAHTSVVAGMVAFDQNRVRTSLIAGTREPGGPEWPEHARVPDSLRAALLATFNSGFKFQDTDGGFFADGRYGKPLKDGMASLVIDRSGTATVGVWGRDVRPGPQVAAVRQNLELIVDGGVPVPGLAGNPAGRWGSAGNQFQYTWRSGIGTDARGRLIYVAGSQLTLTALAGAMASAGVVRGMELDIHSGRVDCTLFRPGLKGAAPNTLLPSMLSPPDRYLTADQRDFFAVTLRAVAGAIPAPG